jgi:hypothetical protein
MIEANGGIREHKRALRFSRTIHTLAYRLFLLLNLDDAQHLDNEDPYGDQQKKALLRSASLCYSQVGKRRKAFWGFDYVGNYKRQAEEG